MHLYIHIEVGNDAMQTGKDAVKALIDNCLNADDPMPLQAGESSSIRDLNGNRVGSWHVQEKAEGH